jgi:hypothetical protein
MATMTVMGGDNEAIVDDKKLVPHHRFTAYEERRS